MTDKEIIEMLEESNMELSYLLAGGQYNKNTGAPHISYLFGRPLNKIYNMILEHEERQRQNENRNHEES